MRFARSLSLVLLLCALPILAQTSATSDPTLWPEPQRAFFQDGPGLLLSAEERSEILGVDEAGRERILREFLDRDPLPETPDNELRVGIERRARLVAHELPSPRDARAQLLFLRGRPAERLVVDCAAAFRPLEVWSYRGSDGVAKDLVLYRPSFSEPFRLWLPIDSKRALYTSEMQFWLFQWDFVKLPLKKRIDRFFCPDSVRVDAATGVDGLGVGSIKGANSDYGAEDRPAPPAPPDGPADSAPDFRWVRPENRIALLWGPADLASWAREAAATVLPPEPEHLETGTLDVDFPRSQGQRLLSRILVSLPSTAGMANSQETPPRVRLAVDAVLEREGEIFEDFRVRYQITPPAPGAPAALLMERAVRPGQSFVLRLRIKDETSGAEARLARGFRVPGGPERSLPSELVATAVGGEMLRPGGVTGPDTLLILPPPSDVMLGVWRAETVVSGERIVKVVFLLDGQPQLSRTRPPYSAEMRLAGTPREQAVRVEGYGPAGDLVAWDQVVVNQARGRFRVLITDPKRGSKGAKAEGKAVARAEVVVPEERRVESVEFRVNDRVAATLTQPPWQHEVQVPAEGDLAYLTVTARLDDGTQAEDVRFLRAPANLGEVEVDLVELFATALDGSGHPVRGLQAADFEVIEGGKPQKVVRFEQVDDLPLSLGIAIDTSFSMASSLAEAQRAAAGFVHHLLTPKDRGFTLQFGGRPELLVPPIDDAEAVALSLEGLRAFGRTVLHDAIITSLYYFRAERGQRALVLLTDGEDTASGTSWEDALAYARKGGVTIYTIGLGKGPRDKLTELAQATGGRAFFIERADELSGVYGQISEELRSRYLLTYSSDRPADASGFRPVEVRIKKGLKARVSRGTYP